MNQTLLKIIASREDISDYLFHFTKGSHAFETLGQIIDDRQIKDVNQNGVICFTEAPITLLNDMFEIFDKYPEPMYAPYGIAVKKHKLFNLGARPVIYSTIAEKSFLANDIQWRFEEYDPTKRDYSWLREWRIKAPFVELTPDNCFIITKTKDENESLTFSDDNLSDIEFDGCVSDGQFVGYATGYFNRGLKGLSIEDIFDISKLSKKEFEELIQTQSFDDSVGRSLGSFLS
jgi:hypothetical protein